MMNALSHAKRQQRPLRTREATLPSASDRYERPESYARGQGTSRKRVEPCETQATASGRHLLVKS